MSVPAAYEELRHRLAEVSDIARTAGLAAWDQRTKMPRSADTRTSTEMFVHISAPSHREPSIAYRLVCL